MTDSYLIQHFQPKFINNGFEIKSSKVFGQSHIRAFLLNNCMFCDNKYIDKRKAFKEFSRLKKIKGISACMHFCFDSILILINRELLYNG